MKKKMKTSKKTTFSQPKKNRASAKLQKPGRHKGDGQPGMIPNNADMALGRLTGKGY